MWKLKVADGGNDPYIYSTNDFVGRQIFEFDPEAGTPEERAEVEEVRLNFYNNRYQVKPSGDLLWRMQFLKEKNFKQTIPPVKVEDGEEITYEKATASLRRSVHFFSALQASDGHWPAENAGPLFFLPPLVMCTYITGHLNTVFPAEHRKEILRYIYYHQNEDGGWGLHIEGHSTMFCTALSYICMRILGEGPDGGQDNACARARKWILDHGSVTHMPSWGKTWLSEDIYYPHPWIQDIMWDSLYICTEPLLTRWPFNKLIREKALQVTMKHIHYEDENSTYITIGCVEKVMWIRILMYLIGLWRKILACQILIMLLALLEQVLCMLACWAEDPNGDYFKKHLARIPDYLWVAEDGMKMQSFGSQEWDTGFAIQALLASNLTDEIGPTLARGHDFIKKSQVKDNPSGDFKSMYRHISKGSWTFSDQDHGWQVSDCTAEGLKSKNGGLAAWEPAGAADWLEMLNPTEFFADIVVEHEYVECTSSAIQALVLFKKLYPGHRKKEIDNFITNATQYLESIQMPDGSWYV
ncbi:hypothetical protein ACE6H2_009640 [Prunus campanulata]